MRKFIIITTVTLLLVYQWKLFVPDTWYEPKIGDINDFLKFHGYPVETHHVQTDDGYILTIHRIPNGRNEVSLDKTKMKPPVFLMHGLLLSSIDWVILGPEKAMGLVLADAGYDVWIGNNRGNTYSRSHVRLDPYLDKTQFYNYSYHEIGISDLPAMIDYVLVATGNEKISYIGFSEGVTSFLVMGSLKPEYNDKILVMNAFAPVTNVFNVTNVLFNVLALSPNILGTVDLIGWYEIFDYTTAPIFRVICQIRPMCNNLFRFLGLSHEQMPKQEFQLTVLSNFPAGMSLKQITHYIQGTSTGIFGPLILDTNEISSHKNHTTYDLTKVTAPIILYYGEDDIFVNNDILLDSVAKELPNVIKKFMVPYPKFNHLDFLWGKDIRLLTEEALININMYNNKTK